MSPPAYMRSVSYSSGSSGRVRGEAEKYETYVAAFGSHLFMTYFYMAGGGGHGRLTPPGSATELHKVFIFETQDIGQVSRHKIYKWMDKLDFVQSIILLARYKLEI